MGKTNLDELVLSGNLTAANITASGTLEYDSLSVTGDATVGDDLTVIGDISGATITTTGNAAVGGTLGVTGATTTAAITTSGNVEVGSTGSPKYLHVYGGLYVGDYLKFDAITTDFDVTTADATDESTAIALANANKAAINKLVTYLRTGEQPT